MSNINKIVNSYDELIAGILQLRDQKDLQSKVVKKFKKRKRVQQWQRTVELLNYMSPGRQIAESVKVLRNMLR